ncbi:hypothetical protein C8R44DRAFT_864865 [Mycena epipterygia]|nr:hypothetical protein C8R44DRAFT_864865 [Mycena epipterygia]
MSRSANALLAQELWDEVVDCVSCDSEYQDIKACSLVSRALAYRAQAHLFRDIGFRRPASSFHDRYIQYDPAAASRRLRCVLNSSPHLVQFIRSITIPLSLDILAEVSDMGLSHVQKICIHENGPTPPLHDAAIAAAMDRLQALVGMPAVREVEISCDYYSPSISRRLSQLFKNPSPTLAALHISFARFRQSPKSPDVPCSDELNFDRISITELRLRDSGPVGSWLVRPDCPFSFSHLAAADITYSMSPELGQILSGAQALKSLALDAEDITEDLHLSRFSALESLHISVTSTDQLAAIAKAISTLSPHNLVEEVSVLITNVWEVEEDIFNPFDDVLAVPSMRKVHISIEEDPVDVAGETIHRAEAERVIMGFLPRLRDRGVLRVDVGR